MRQTLDSLKNQRLSDYELLILYNGTDAAVLTQLEEFAAEHDNALVMPESAPLTMFANFNRGLRKARGEYVAFFHDDDIYEPDFLSRIIALMDIHPSAAFAGSNYHIIGSDNSYQGHRRLIKNTGIRTGHEFIRDLVHRGRGVIPTPGIVFRKSAFDSAGWDERLSMHFGDFVVLMRLSEKHDALLIAEPLLKLRLHGQNASNVPMSTASPMLFRALDSYVNEFESRWPLMTDFARALRSSARHALKRSLIWGWISATDDDEADRCTALLSVHGSTFLATSLDLVSTLGFRATRRRGLARQVRRLGQVSG